MYWRYQSIPELADIPPDRQKAIWQQARQDPFRLVDVLWFLAFLLVVCVLGVALYLARTAPIWLALGICVAHAVAMGFAFEALMILRYRPVVRRLVRGS